MDNAVIIKVIAAFLAFFFPPVAVLLAKGGMSHLLLSILLTIFFWIPGVIHALYIVFREDLGNLSDENAGE